MIKLMLVLHVLGFVAWLGGSLASMVTSIAAGGESREVLGPLVRVQSSLARALIGPGAGVTVATGLILTFKMYGPSAPAPSAWMMVMQGAGIVAAVIALAFCLPTASRLRSLNPVGPHAAHFDALRARQRLTGSVSGSLGILALVAGVLARFG